MPSSTEIDLEYMTLLMQSSFDARTSSSDTSAKNGLRSCNSELENSNETSRDNLNKNKDSVYVQSIFIFT